MWKVRGVRNFRTQFLFKSWVLATFLLLWNLRLSCAAPKKMLDKIRCTKDQYGNQQCTCPEEPITEKYPDVKDKTCDYYYLCHLGRALKLRCGFSFAFHPKLQQCLPRNRIPSDFCKPLVDCPMRINRFVEDKKDCTKYFLCFRGTFTHWSCPENAYFEPESERCANDRMQADACIAVSKKNLFNRIEFEKHPPKTSEALNEAKAHQKAEAERKKKEAKSNNSTKKG